MDAAGGVIEAFKAPLLPLTDADTHSGNPMKRKQSVPKTPSLSLRGQRAIYSIYTLFI